jgi:glycosidase
MISSPVLKTSLLAIFLLAACAFADSPPAAPPAEKVRIYQLLPRVFGNTNETRKPNGSIEENGSGKFSDLNETSLAAIKAMGFTHVWPTGVLQQATATDYSAIGEPGDDPDLLKGLAGSPYAIKDYFDVSPDYADDPAHRLDEFKAMIDRVHKAGLKVIMDFVPNHVARSYQSTVRPDLSFGAKDDKSKFFAADNNFYWLTPEAKPAGKGPPLRLPTVDAQGNPTSPTSKAAKAPSDGLFAPESEHGRITGNNLVSWEPDAGSWYETVKLNYGYDFTDPQKKTRAYPHGDRQDIPIPDTWRKMDEIISYWQGFGIDGFRVDMAHMVPPEFWRWMIARARGRNPQIFFVAEAYNDDPAKVPAGDSSSTGNVMADLVNAGFDAVYDDATYDKLKDIYEGGAWANDLDRLNSGVFDRSLRYAENHDEARIAGKGQWANVGMEVGRPVSALLFALSRGPVMLYSGQEVGEPADGAEGFGGDDARTSIFDYWSAPELAKWVNGKKFDGGRLSPAQSSLRDYYAQLLRLIGEPAFQNGGFFPLNPANIENPSYGRVPGEQASGHWLYSFLRRDPATGQKFLAVINLSPSRTFDDVRVKLPPAAVDFLGLKVSSKIQLSGKLGSSAKIESGASDLPLGSLPPLSANFFEITE